MQTISQFMFSFMHLIRLLVTHFPISITVIQLTLYKGGKKVYTVDTTHEEFGFYCLEIFETRIIHPTICPSHHITETS